MMFDHFLKMAEGTALSTAAPGTSVLGTAIDLAQTSYQEIMPGLPLRLFVEVTTGITSGGSGTVTLQFVTADNAALTTNVEIVMSSQTKTAPQAAGVEFFNVELPRYNYRKYIGLRQVIGTAALTAGAVFAALTGEPGRAVSLPSNTGL